MTFEAAWGHTQAVLDHQSTPQCVIMGFIVGRQQAGAWRVAKGTPRHASCAPQPACPSFRAFAGPRPDTPTVFRAHGPVSVRRYPLLRVCCVSGRLRAVERGENGGCLARACALRPNRRLWHARDGLGGPEALGGTPGPVEECVQRATAVQPVSLLLYSLKKRGECDGTPARWVQCAVAPFSAAVFSH